MTTISKHLPHTSAERSGPPHTCCNLPAEGVQTQFELCHSDAAVSTHVGQSTAPGSAGATKPGKGFHPHTNTRACHSTHLFPSLLPLHSSELEPYMPNDALKKTRHPSAQQFPTHCSTIL
eukprot:604831-Alexandrium_andersonii.AAC.1